MSANDLLLLIALIVLAGFVGFSGISKDPNSLHTPLMSGTNAIHGIVVLGAMWVLGSVDLSSDNTAINVLLAIILFVAVVFGTLNVVGGFVVTDRMLEMFKPKERKPIEEAQD